MPRIAAASVREHRAQMQDKLIEAAERILQRGEQLTAGEVASAAGIARNSLYRYVDSVEDLRILVLDKHLPEWSDSVACAVAAAPTPRDKVLAFVEASLAGGAPGGRTWLMRMAAAITDKDDRGRVHARLAQVLEEQVRAAGAAPAALVVAVINAVVQAGHERLEAGDEEAVVVAGCLAAVRGVLDQPPRPG